MSMHQGELEGHSISLKHFLCWPLGALVCLEIPEKGEEEELPWMATVFRLKSIAQTNSTDGRRVGA